MFHSSPYSDDEEKREHRRREIELIDKGKKELIISYNIPRTFANSNLEKFAKNVDFVKEIALNTKDEGIKNALKGMMQRPDRHYVLRDFNNPVMLIAGVNDNYIPLKISKTIAKNAPNLQLEIFENSGHMGFIEEKEKAVKVIKEFANKLKW